MDEQTLKNSSNDSEEINKEKSNLDLAYTYTSSFLQKCNDNLDDLNTRLTTFLGFGGILLRFALELSDSCPSALLFKIVVLGSSAISLCQSCYGLLVNPTGKVPKPSALMNDENFQEENLRVKASIVNTWIAAIDELEISLRKKQRQLNRAIWFLISAVVAFTLNALLSSFFDKCI